VKHVFRLSKFVVNRDIQGARRGDHIVVITDPGMPYLRYRVNDTVVVKISAAEFDHAIANGDISEIHPLAVKIKRRKAHEGWQESGLLKVADKFGEQAGEHGAWYFWMTLPDDERGQEIITDELTRRGHEYEVVLLEDMTFGYNAVHQIVILKNRTKS